MKELYHIDDLAPLINLNRADDRIEQFIGMVSTKPTITIDKDDTDDEFMEFRREGFGLHFMNGVLESIHFQFGRKESEYTRYRHPLPFGICFEQSKSEILDVLGPPDVQGGGRDGFFGDIPDWFKYNRDGYALHVEFGSDSESIESVTIMAPDRE